MRDVNHWRGRATTLEAMAVLVLARFLVAKVPFARWRVALGRRIDAVSSGSAERRDANAPARRLARAVDRAASRLPGESKCLPRAMALQWLLRRRGLGATLVIGVSPGDARGGLDDLHAWVVRDGEVLLGATGQLHHRIYAAQTAEDA